jgi:glyoxylase-like metal-dependent hydrolase (beta-lactamase superfamily II)
VNIILRISAGIGIFIVIAAILRNLYRLVLRVETSKMTPVDSKKIVEGIYAVRDRFVNMYLVVSESGYVAIDASAKMSNVKMELDNMKIDPSDVTAIFLTHTDTDHTGSLKLFENAKVYISSEEERMINGKTSRGAVILRNKLECDYEVLEDNETVDIAGLKVKGILTPGHTYGSMSYLVNGKYLFTGDTLRLRNGKAERFNRILNMDSFTQLKSLKKLAALAGVEYILTSHYGYTSDIKRAFGEW